MPRRSQAQIGALSEIGSTGLNRSGGFILEEQLPELSGGRWAKVLAEMLANDPKLAQLSDAEFYDKAHQLVMTMRGVAPKVAAPSPAPATSASRWTAPKPAAPSRV